jgi:hypothetical protein
MIGEKVSLKDVLKPIAEAVHGELMLATGEVSEAAGYGIARRAAEDGRPLIILYFSDFDPSGWQMPVSVARKIQGHIRYRFPKLDARVIRVALTLDQVNEFKLPDSPLKLKEKRKNAWFKEWGLKQVEIDALAALRPEVLDKIARDAVAPYFDFTYERRYAKAIELSKKQSNWFFNQPAYRKAEALVEQAHQPAVEAVAALADAKTAAIEAMQHVVDTKGPDLPEIVVTPKIGDEPESEEFVFDSRDDFVTATGKLKEITAYAKNDAKNDDDDDADTDDEDDADDED